MSEKVGAGRMSGRTRGFKSGEIRDEWVSSRKNGLMVRK